MSLPDIPTSWTPEVGARRTVDEAQNAINNPTGICIAKISKRIHPYESTLQSLWNGLRTFAIGYGIDRVSSEGSAIEYQYYCYNDTQTSETRTQTHTELMVDNECKLHVTRIEQKQTKVKRKWVKWTITHTFENDWQTTAIDTAIGVGIGVLGLPATGALAIVTFTAGAAISFDSMYDNLKKRSVWVSRETAEEDIWMDTGTATSVATETVQLDNSLCNLMRRFFPSIAEGERTESR